MTEAEAESFLHFRQFEKEFDLLVKSGIFGVRNGSAEIHFDPHGSIASIDLHFRVFRAPKGIPVAAVVVETVDTNKLKV